MEGDVLYLLVTSQMSRQITLKMIIINYNLLSITSKYLMKKSAL